jgi:glycosyltransferase involved in cell wall biosynthesis
MSLNFHILFYTESEAFGGHEKMAVAAHAAIQRRYDSVRIQWLISKQNDVLKAALDDAGLMYTTVGTGVAYSLWRNPFCSLAQIWRNAVMFRRLSPDLVLVVQGEILLSFGGIVSAWLAWKRVCSYIPMVSRISDSKNFRFPVLADFAWSLLYRGVSSYITIDDEQAGRLHRENRKASVVVVENYVPKPQGLGSALSAREILSIPPGKTVLSLIGRIEFSHKCQDWTLQVLKNDSFLADKLVLFVGDGSDLDALQSMLVPEVRDRFKLIGWTGDLREVYAATDVLLIPSRSEGVPLVMLEALSHGIPVVGTDRDGMRSWLPVEWRFRWGDVEGFKHGIERALSGTPSEVWAGIDERLKQVQDENRFAAQFSEALIHYCRQ